MIENTTEGQAKDMILKYCVENRGLNASSQIRRKLFPDVSIDVINLLIEKISYSEDPVAEFRLNVRTKYIKSNGITPIFLKQGGYTKSEMDEKELNEKSEQKENLEEQIRELTRDNLRLGNWDIRFRWYIAAGSFIIGIIVKYFIDK